MLSKTRKGKMKVVQPVFKCWSVWPHGPALLCKQASYYECNPPLLPYQRQTHTHKHKWSIRLLYMCLEFIRFNLKKGFQGCGGQGGSMKTTVPHYIASLLLNVLHTLIWPWSEAQTHTHTNSSYEKTWSCSQGRLNTFFLCLSFLHSYQAYHRLSIVSYSPLP